jgi:chromosomal replication initiator protein
VKPSVKSIIEATAVQFDLTPEQIIEPHTACKTRLRGIVRPRQVAMYLARELSTQPPGDRRSPKRSPVSYPTLGRIFRRDHSTVIHACRTIPKLAANDSELSEKVKQIRQLIEVEG